MERIRLEIREYIRQNLGIYIFITVLFALGVLAGALLMRSLEESQRELLNRYFNLLVERYHGQDVPAGAAILGQSLKNYLYYLVLVWLCGMFAFGFPLIMAAVGLRGFAVGFTVGFLVDRAALRGLLFAIGSVLPHHLFLVPAMIVCAVSGFSFSWLRFRGHLERRSVLLKEHLAPYTLMSAGAGLVLLVGSLVEAYISPVFTKLLITIL